MAAIKPGFGFATTGRNIRDTFHGFVHYLCPGYMFYSLTSLFLVLGSLSAVASLPVSFCSLAMTLVCLLYQEPLVELLVKLLEEAVEEIVLVAYALLQFVWGKMCFFPSSLK